MKLLVAIGVLLCTIATHSKPTKNICEDEKLTCYQTEYSAYVKCVEKQRIKRQACLFADSMQPQVVQPVQTGILQPQMLQGQTLQAPQIVQAPQIMQAVQPQCGSSGCNQGAGSQVIIDTCMNSCAARCSGNLCAERCSASCQSSPPPYIVNQQPQVIPQSPQPVTIIEKSGSPQHAPTPNVTTIIKLTNIINNTNVVNVPTTINNTNVNNVDIVTNSSSKAEKCCTVVQPKVCSNVHTINNRTVYRCIHRRHNTCGNQCTSNIMHAQVRQPCNGPAETCPPAISYIPQPEPKCTYQQSWPYVKCGGNQNPSCEGCYDHYGYGFQQYHGEQQPECNGCYDDGFSPGSLYRQGPFYRPGYYHAPPCYMTGTCGYVQQPLLQHMDCGMEGCFGHELIDPSFGMQSFSPYSAYYRMMAPMPPFVQPYFDNSGYYISNGTSALNENGEIEENSIIPVNQFSNPLPNSFYGLPFGFQPFLPFNIPIKHMSTNETVLVEN